MIKVVPVDKTSGESIYTIDQLNDIQGKTIVLSPEYSTLIFSAKPLKSQGKVAAKVDVGDLSSELDRILVKGLPNIKPGTGVVIKTLLTEVKTDDSTIGYMYKINGLANVESVDNGIATCRVIYNYQEINKDDIVDDTMKGIAPLVIKPAVNNNIAMTSILDVWNNCAGGGNGDVIFIASGSKKGVKQGDIINLYKPVAVKDGKKPKTIYEPIGNAIVLQAVENSSMALITYSLMYIEEGFSASGK